MRRSIDGSKIIAGSQVRTWVARSHVEKAHLAGHLSVGTSCGQRDCISSSHPRCSQHLAMCILSFYTCGRAIVAPQRRVAGPLLVWSEPRAEDGSRHSAQGGM